MKNNYEKLRLGGAYYWDEVRKIFTMERPLCDP